MSGNISFSKVLKKATVVNINGKTGRNNKFSKQQNELMTIYLNCLKQSRTFIDITYKHRKLTQYYSCTILFISPLMLLFLLLSYYLIFITN